MPAHVSVRAVDASNRDATPETRTFVVDSPLRIASGPTLTRDTTPSFGFASSPPGATFQCTVDDGAFAACTSPHTTGARGRARTRSRCARSARTRDPTPAVLTFRVDATAPETRSPRARTATVHSGPLAFGVGANEDATFECALDDGDYGSCAATYRAEDLAPRRARLPRTGDRPRRQRRRHARRAPVHRRQRRAGARPLSSTATPGRRRTRATFEIGATDADGDRLSYELDFGDGQSATRRAAGLARAPLRRRPASTRSRLTVRDARTSSDAPSATVTVTTHGSPPPALSLQLSAPAVALGTFIPASPATTRAR